MRETELDVKIFPTAINIIVATKTKTRTQMYRIWTKQTFALFIFGGVNNPRLQEEING